ncbi:hypothetical protein PSTG_04635 [Puccinia striiformis f. sp. tritici PST-78]|uniref:Uncharacterized protein n=1 Tax=Puccinia striiformis f. sp. tritici PST-78 TaxID=1165861 RepID=A0A0L0VSF3_9BASI|nr:hypothetical protein PSTG_04635 [Puccinia striiformis f. sp. tritici PST-78]
MSSPFIGSPISAELLNRTIVEGNIQDIDPRTAQFVKFDGTFSEIQASFMLKKDSVKDLMLLRTTRQNSASSPSDSDSSSSPTQNCNPHQLKKNQQQNSAINHHNGSEVTIKQQQQPTPSRKKRRDQAKKQHNLHGNPLPKIHMEYLLLLNDLPQPLWLLIKFKLLPLLLLVSFALISIKTLISKPAWWLLIRLRESNGSIKLYFFRIELWAEIASTDSTDPKNRLVSHNQEKINGVHFNLNNQQQGGGGRQILIEEENLRWQQNSGPTEMVLSMQEQVTNGSTVLNPICSQQKQ